MDTKSKIKIIRKKIKNQNDEIKLLRAIEKAWSLIKQQKGNL